MRPMPVLHPPPGRRKDAGQGLAEFAIMAPVLLLMVFGLIDFVRGWQANQTITDAAREGARACAVHEDFTEQRVIDEVVLPALQTAHLEGAVTITAEGCENEGPAPVTVRIEYDYTLSLLGIFLEVVKDDPTVTLITEVEMLNE